MVGALMALGQLLSLLTNLLGMSFIPMGEFDMDQRWASWMTGGIGTFLAFLGLLIAGFAIWAALQMKELKNWTVAVVANILVMIPCFSGLCCIFGLPIGIWGLVILFRPDVKAAFTG